MISHLGLLFIYGSLILFWLAIIGWFIIGVVNLIFERKKDRDLHKWAEEFDKVMRHGSNI